MDVPVCGNTTLPIRLIVLAHARRGVFPLDSDKFTYSQLPIENSYHIGRSIVKLLE
jgi:hypothetical protein